MENSCRRTLDNNVAVEHFLYNILGLEAEEEAVSKIVEAEASIDKYEQHPTKTHEDYRSKKYRKSAQRKTLHDQILKELIDDERLQDDNKISLGCGGAKPKVEVKKDAVAYLVSGPPASGKSGIASRLADKTHAYILDSDYAKRKFPEYYNSPCGASLVHQESDDVVFGNNNSLLEYCVYNRFNVVIPIVGRTVESVKKIRERLSAFNYKVHLINVVLDRYECTRRAYNRFMCDNRYVPLSYVFDEVGNEPERIFYVIQRTYAESNPYKSYTLLSNAVPRGESPEVLYASEQSPYAKTEG